jgi:hypothetical protein
MFKFKINTSDYLLLTTAKINGVDSNGTPSAGKGIFLFG